jgi:Recombinase
MEQQRIRERTQSMRLRRAKSGKLIVGAFPKYGYLWVRDARMRVVYYAIDPETAPVVQEILTRVAQGDPVRQLVFDLNRRGIPTRGQILKVRGLLSPNQALRVQNHWTHNAIAALVYSPEYSGWHLNYHSVSSYSDTPHPLTGLPRSRPQRRQLLRRAEAAYLPLAELREQYGEFPMLVPALVDEDIQQAAMARFTHQSHARQSARRHG